MSELKPVVRIGQAEIGASMPVWIVAEAGVNPLMVMIVLLNFGKFVSLI